MISEVWHGKKWQSDIDRHLLTPMYDDGYDRHYYIDEVARTTEGKLLVPIRWLQDEDRLMWAEAWQISFEGEVSNGE